MSEFGVNEIIVSGRDPYRVQFRLSDQPATDAESAEGEWVEICVLVGSPNNPPLLNLQMRSLRRAREVLDAYATELENATGQGD